MAQIYDKFRKEILTNLNPNQVEAMAKYKPGRYTLPADVEDVEEDVDEVVDEKVPDNSDIDATRGAIELADEKGIDLNALYQGERILQKDVQNYLDE